MSETVIPAPAIASRKPRVGLTDLFLTFLQIGATSFGGGVVAYLRSALVGKKKWLNDVEFPGMYGPSADEMKFWSAAQSA